MKTVAILLFALIVLVSCQDETDTTFPEIENTCVFIGLSSYDLSSVTRYDGQPAYSWFDSATGVWWEFNICGRVSGLVMDDQSPLTDCGVDSSICAVNVTAVVQVPSAPPTNVLSKVEIKQYTNAGNVNPQFYEYDSGIGLWYQGDLCSTGENFTSFLFINCDPLSTFTVISVDTSYACYSQIIVNSSLACSGNDVEARPKVCIVSLLFTGGICFAIVSILCCCIACCCARKQRKCNKSNVNNANISFQPLPQNEVVQTQPVIPTAPVSMTPYPSSQFIQMPQYYYYPMQPQFVQQPFGQPATINSNFEEVQVDADEKMAIELQSKFDREV